jgi:hypothetical protein
MQDLMVQLEDTMALADKPRLPLIAMKLSSAIDVLGKDERVCPSLG